MTPEFIGFTLYENGVMIYYKGRMISDGIGHAVDSVYYSESDIKKYPVLHKQVPPEISMAMQLIQEQKRQ